MDEKIGGLCRPTRSGNFCMTWQIFVGQFYCQSKLANFIDPLTSFQHKFVKRYNVVSSCILTVLHC